MKRMRPNIAWLEMHRSILIYEVELIEARCAELAAVAAYFQQRIADLEKTLAQAGAEDPAPLKEEESP